MDLTFGARLRHQREQRQVTLTTISAATKIKVSLLESLESDDLSQWPRGLYGRAYVRDYARVIGLDPESTLAEFLAVYPEFAHITAEAEEAEAAARLEASSRPADKLRRFVSAAFSGTPARPQPSWRDAIGPAMGESQVLALAMASDRVRETPAAEMEEVPPAPDPIPPLVSVSDLRNELGLAGIADVCARLARALDWCEVTTLLADAAKLLDAVGVIVWQWDARATALRPSLAYGYAQAVLARLPEVHRDASNAVAAAFRSGERCVVDGADGSPEAVVVPSMGVNGCVGVLAVELRPGAQQRESVCAFTTILAAQLAMLLPPVPEPATV